MNDCGLLGFFTSGESVWVVKEVQGADCVAVPTLNQPLVKLTLSVDFTERNRLKTRARMTQEKCSVKISRIHSITFGAKMCQSCDLWQAPVLKTWTLARWAIDGSRPTSREDQPQAPGADSAERWSRWRACPLAVPGRSQNALLEDRLRTAGGLRRPRPFSGVAPNRR